jgi:iron complex transport system ATP-binding protein
MNTVTPLLRFTDVSFTWPDPDTGEISVDAAGRPQKPVFDAFTAEIPPGFISLTGANGSGKTTFMLLAGGRIMPSSGRIELAGNNTRVLSGLWADDSGTPGPGLTAEIEHRRNLVCSFLYQNMEFDTDDDAGSVGSLLEFVYANGGRPHKDDGFYRDVLSVFELNPLLGRTLTALSKGEIQRVLLAFSALYESKVIMMDEPVFAMEQRQKEKALEFFSDIYTKSGVSIIVSLHELALTRKYADTAMLFYPDRRIDLGTCEEVLTDEALEEAYGFPAAMMYDAENLNRRTMLESARICENPEAGQ